MKILLTGFMGAGKTTVGRRLAERLDLTFVDLDQAIEEGAGATVREIFQSRGEEEFRRLERLALERVLELPAAVVATGGGTLVDEENAQLARAHATTVWLNTPFEVIKSRLGVGSQDDRPLYVEAPELGDLFTERLPAYRRADLSLDIGAEESVDDVVDRLNRMLEEAECVTW